MQIEISDDFYFISNTFLLMRLLHFSINSLYYGSYGDNQIIKMVGRKKAIMQG